MTKKPRIVSIGVSRETLPYIGRVFGERLRRHGQFVRLVDAMLQRDEQPAKEDVALAILEAAEQERPLPIAIAKHVVELYVRQSKPRKTGRQAPKWSYRDAVPVVTVYQEELKRASYEAEEGMLGETPSGRERRSVVTTAQKRAARRLDMSKPTLIRILRDHPITVS